MEPGATLEVMPGECLFADPWRVPPSASPVLLVDSTTGLQPRLPTEVAIYYDPRTLYLVFQGDDHEVVAKYLSHDEPLYEEDVVEVFLAPENPLAYFELEVNPLGTIFDARIALPNGTRASMQSNLRWDCIGCWSAVRRIQLEKEVSRFAVLLSIPFASLDRDSPRPGETWRANLFRIDRSPAGDEYTAWRPTRRRPPDFHVPSAFGELVFKA